MIDHPEDRRSRQLDAIERLFEAQGLAPFTFDGGAKRSIIWLMLERWADVCEVVEAASTTRAEALASLPRRKNQEKS